MPFKQASEEEVEKSVQSRAGSKLWSPVGGEDGKWRRHRVRILPPRDDHPDNTYMFWASVHQNLPGAGRAVLCPNKTHDLPCAACQVAQSFANLSTEAGKKQASKFWPQTKVLVNVAILDVTSGDVKRDEDGEPDIQVRAWAMSKSLFEDLRAKINERPKAQRNITDLDTGYDVIVRRKGKTQTDTRYEISLVEDPSPVSPLILEWLEEEDARLPDLTKQYPDVDSERIEAYLHAPEPKKLPAGKDPFPEDDDDDDDEAVDASFRTLPAGDDDDDDDSSPTVRNGAAVGKASAAGGGHKAAKDKEAASAAARDELAKLLGQSDDED